MREANKKRHLELMADIKEKDPETQKLMVELMNMT